MPIRAMLLGLCLVTASSFTASLAQAAPSEGQPAPELDLVLADGSHSSLAEVSAKRATVVLFWASWCPYCKALMPHLQSIMDEYGHDQIEVIAVDVREDDPADGRQALDSQGYDFLLVSDGDPVAKDWGINGLPRVYLIGADGRVLYDQSAHPAQPQRRGSFSEASSNSAKAARMAPLWAAQLRKAMDQRLH